MKIEKILKEAVERGASDVLITTGSKPALRIANSIVALDDHPILTKETASGYIAEIMTAAQTEEFKKAMDVDFSVDVEGIARFRVNVFMQRKGIASTMRVIPSKIPTMEELVLPETFGIIPKLSNGLVLVTGPTGSGKSTTIAAMINDINHKTGSHIITIEDPIEFVYENDKSIIEQREVGAHTESFSKALRAALREAPDVILVGEMRDLETIALAITAAETGHLVFATLHTSGTAQSVNRMIDIFPGERQNQIRAELAEALRVVIWQKLFKRKDGAGRVGGYELLLGTPAVANMIRENKTHQIATVIETGAIYGMQTMAKSIESLIAKDLITRHEASENLHGFFLDSSEKNAE